MANILGSYRLLLLNLINYLNSIKKSKYVFQLKHRFSREFRSVFDFKNEANIKKLHRFFTKKMSKFSERANNLNGIEMFLPSGKLNNKYLRR